MLIGILFWSLTIIGCLYAALLGSRDGRWAALLITSASLLSIPAALLSGGWARTEHALFTVDALLLVGLLTLAMKSDRYFPIWMAGFQLISVLTHLSTLMAPDFAPKIYRALGSLWAMPITVSMMWGIYLDRRNNLPPVGNPTSDPPGVLQKTRI